MECHFDMRLPEIIATEKVVPVARHLDETSAPRMVAALRDGGIHSIEITVESEGGISAIAAVAGGGTLVGAGTVVSITQAVAAVEAGAGFIVSPHFDSDLLAWAVQTGTPMIPGALTPTEVFRAWSGGPAAVKIFPADVSGPGYLRTLFGPYPNLKLLPTGGITSENIGDFLSAGAVAVGVGGWLTATDDYAKVTRRAALLVERTAVL